MGGTDNLYRGLPFEQLWITCESCHGNAREHVATKSKAPMVNPVTLAPERRDSTCVVYHLEGDTSVEQRNRAVLDFKPGDDIRESITYFVAAGENTTKRAVSEVEQFSSSRCKVVTGAKMSCMSCHNPHLSPTAGERVGFYRAKCLACHSGQTFTAQHFPTNPDCTSCHMPKTGSENIAHVAWTDHRIRRRPDRAEFVSSGSEQKSDQPTDLVSVLPGTISARDLGLAYYNLAVHGGGSARQKATELLSSAVKTDTADVPVLRSLGILAEMNGDGARAASYYRAALRIEPDNYVAGTNLGTLLAAGGNLEAAAALWKDVFQHNKDVPELGENLALAECQLGNKEQARQVLAEMLTYSPALFRARSMLARVESGELSCANGSYSGPSLKNLPR